MKTVQQYVVLKTIRHPETNLPIVSTGQVVTQQDIDGMAAEYGIDELYLWKCVDSA